MSGKIYPGRIKIGFSDPIRSCFDKTYIKIDGIIECGNNVVIRRGAKIHIDNDATIIFEDNVFIGDCNTIISKSMIHIGANTRVGNNTVFIDTDFHYLVNTQQRTVRNNCGSIEIGENNWIGGWCTIKKGAKTPKGTIIAGPYSMIGKNYCDKIPEYCVIGGSPAKLLVENMRRINNDKTQNELVEYFRYTKTPYIFPEETDLDKLCLPL